MELKQMIAVMQAAAEGKQIQTASVATPNFQDVDTKSIGWDWMARVYRVKLEPKHIWVNDYASSGGSAFIHPTQKDAESWAKTNRTFPPITTEYVEVIK